MNKKIGSKKKPRVPPATTGGAPSGGGEGNRVADRRYRSATTRFAQSEDEVEDAAEDAEEALHGREAKELREAEKKGRAPARE